MARYRYTGPMIANYADRIAVHPDRFGSIRSLPWRYVVLHTSEQRPTSDAAANLANYLTSPGDRLSSSGGRYGSSYHAIADTGLQVIPCVNDDRVAFSAPGANRTGLHICIPGKSGQSREQWLSGSTREAITTVAAFILDTRDRYGIPAERLTVAEVVAGTRGYCDHAAIRDAFGRTTHWDVGPAFPWDVLEADIRRLSQTDPELRPPIDAGDNMQTVNSRILDTREQGDGGRLFPNRAKRIDLPGPYAAARAVQLSVVAVEPDRDGYLAVWQGSNPGTSTVNYRSGSAAQGTTIVAVDRGGFWLQSSSPCHLVIDVQAMWT